MNEIKKKIWKEKTERIYKWMNKRKNEKKNDNDQNYE